MVILLVDINLDGHAEVLDARLRTETWREVRDHLGMVILRFREAGLPQMPKTMSFGDSARSAAIT